MPRLRRSDPSSPGIARHRRGRGFSYTWARTGDRVDDPDTLERIDGLVIPPAWTDVWICPWPHGHIHAVGTDAAGRRRLTPVPDAPRPGPVVPGRHRTGGQPRSRSCTSRVISPAGRGRA